MPVDKSVAEYRRDIGRVSSDAPIRLAVPHSAHGDSAGDGRFDQAGLEATEMPI